MYSILWKTVKAPLHEINFTEIFLKMNLKQNPISWKDFTFDASQH